MHDPRILDPDSGFVSFLIRSSRLAFNTAARDTLWRWWSHVILSLHSINGRVVCEKERIGFWDHVGGLNSAQIIK